MAWYTRRRDTTPASPLSKRAAALGLGFAIVAAGASAAGASTMSDMLAVQIVLVIASILAVVYERQGLTWARTRRARKDNRAANAALALLMIAGLYTASMQVTFFGSLMLKPIAADERAHTTLADLDQRIEELMARYQRSPQPKGTRATLAREIAALERDAGRKEKSFREAAAAAAKALPAKRAELSQLEAFLKLEADLAVARAERQQRKGEPPGDVKGAIFSAITGADGHLLSYGMVLFAVLFLQLGQILLPTVAGRAEIEAARAAAARIDGVPAGPASESVPDLKAQPAAAAPEAQRIRPDETRPSARGMRDPKPAAPARAPGKARARPGRLAGKLN
jgi:hypothetical protein